MTKSTAASGSLRTRLSTSLRLGLRVMPGSSQPFRKNEKSYPVNICAHLIIRVCGIPE
jgi:hypothetical protein